MNILSLNNKHILFEMALSPNLKDKKYYTALVKNVKAKNELSFDYFDYKNTKQIVFDYISQLEPITHIMDNLKIVRPEEKTKFKNIGEAVVKLKYVLGRLDYFFNFGITVASISEEEYMSFDGYMQRSFEYMDKILKLWDRWYDYNKRPLEFPYKNFNIKNTFGYTEDEIANATKFIDKIIEVLDKKGLQKLLYGYIELSSMRIRKNAGSYNPSNDRITLNVDAPYRFDSIYTLIHELGHRYWYKFMDSAEQKEYVKDFYNRAGYKQIDGNMIKKWFDIFKKNDYDIKETRKSIRNINKEELELFDSYWTNGRGKHFMKKLDRPEDYAWAEKEFFKKDRNLEDYYANTKSDKSYFSVTSYGETSHVEDFAEIFAHYVLDKNAFSMQHLIEKFKNFIKTT